MQVLDGQTDLQTSRGTEDGYCRLHFAQSDHRDRPEIPNEFQHALEEAIEAGDGDWRGVVFLEPLVLPKHIQIPINASDARFVLSISNNTFSMSRLPSQMRVRKCRLSADACFNLISDGLSPSYLLLRLEKLLGGIDEDKADALIAYALGETGGVKCGEYGFNLLLRQIRLLGDRLALTHLGQLSGDGVDS